MSDSSIAIVTGANRGIGREIARQLARLPNVRVILTSRDETKGRQAVDELKKEGLELDYFKLDVAKDQDVTLIAEFIERNYGRLDILVNNAGVFLDSAHPTAGSSVLCADLDILRQTMDINTYGPLRLVIALIPLMRKRGYGRIVNLSSGMGQLDDMNGGYPGYRLSKLALNGLTRISADELKGTDILVNSMCPGWVKTDMGGPDADRSVEQGAETAIWLATLPSGSASGGFFRDKKTIPW